MNAKLVFSLTANCQLLIINTVYDAFTVGEYQRKFKNFVNTGSGYRSGSFQHPGGWFLRCLCDY